MYGEALLAYAHLLSIFFLAWYLGRQWLLLKDGAQVLQLDKLVRNDIGYFISAGLVLATGLGRLFLSSKPLAFYTQNGAFHALIGLFVLVGLLSIVPTMSYQKWRRYRRDNPAFEISRREWAWIRGLVVAELCGLVLMPLAAVLMARGI